MCNAFAGNMTWQDYNNLGNKNNSLKNYTEAINDYSAAIKLNSQNSGLYTNRGTTKYVIGDYTGAIEDFKLALSLNKYNNTAKTYLYMAEEKVGIAVINNSPAVKESSSYRPINNDVKQSNTSDNTVKTIQATRENSWEKYANEGINKYNNKDYNGALEDFNTAINIRPQNSDMYKYRSVTKYALKNLEGAIKDIDTAININPNNINYYYIKGQMFNSIKNYDEAITNYKKALVFAPKNQTILRVLSNAQKELVSSHQQVTNTSQNLQGQQNIYKQYGQNTPPKKHHWYDKLLDTFTSIGVGIIMIVGVAYLAEYLNNGWATTEQKENPFYEESVSSKVKEFFNPEEAEKRRKQYESEQFWKQYWDDMSKNGWKFESAVGKLYKKMGYKVTVTQGSGDGGVDLILKKDGITTIVQCKAHKREVGPEPVRALWGVLDDFNAQNAIFIAYSGVTTGAREFASRKALKLIDSRDLVKLSLEVNKEKV